MFPQNSKNQLVPTFLALTYLSSIDKPQLNRIKKEVYLITIMRTLVSFNRKILGNILINPNNWKGAILLQAKID